MKALLRKLELATQHLVSELIARGSAGCSNTLATQDAHLRAEISWQSDKRYPADATTTIWIKPREGYIGQSWLFRFSPDLVLWVGRAYSSDCTRHFLDRAYPFRAAEMPDTEEIRHAVELATAAAYTFASMR